MPEYNVAFRLTADSSGVVGGFQLTRDQLDKMMADLRRRNEDSERQTVAGHSRMLQSVRAFGNGAKQVYDNLRASLFSLQGALAGIGIGLAVKQIADATFAVERMRGQFRAAIGDAQAARRELALVDQVTEALGLNLKDSGAAYAELLQNVRDTPLAGQGARNIFIGVAEAIRAAHGDATQLAGALDIIGAMITKQILDARDLRQLDRAIPGTMGMAAGALGTDDAGLRRMLEDGQVLANNLLPKLAREFDKAFRQDAAAAAHSAESEFVRFDNQVLKLKTTIGESGLLDGLTSAVKELSATFKDADFQHGVREFSSKIGSLIRFVADHPREFAVLAGVVQGARLGVPGAVIGGVGALALTHDGSPEAELARKQGRLNELAARPDAGTPAIQRLIEQTFNEIDTLRQEVEARRANGPGALPETTVVPAAIDRFNGFDDGYDVNQVAPATPEATRKIEELQRQLRLQGQLRGLAGRSPSAAIGAQAAFDAAQTIAETKTNNPEQIARIKELTEQQARSNYELQLATKLYAELRGPQLEFADRLKVINQEYEAGRITAAERARAERDATIDMLDSQKDWQSGVERALLKVQRDFSDTASMSERLVTDAFQSMEDAAVQFARTGKISMDSLTQTILEDLLRIQVRKAAVGIGSGLDSIFKDMFGGGNTPSSVDDQADLNPGVGAEVQHTGGIVGFGRDRRSVAASLFHGAPRFHKGGILPGEVPAILRRGEGVFTPEQMAAMGGDRVSVTVINNSGKEAQVTERRSNGMREIEVMVGDLVTKDIRSGGPISKAIQETTGAGRVLAKR